MDKHIAVHPSNELSLGKQKGQDTENIPNALVKWKKPDSEAACCGSIHIHSRRSKATGLGRGGWAQRGSQEGAGEYPDLESDGDQTTMCREQ